MAQIFEQVKLLSVHLFGLFHWVWVLDFFDSFHPVAGWDNVKGFVFCLVCIDRVELRLVPVVVIVPSKVGYFVSRHGE